MFISQDYLFVNSFLSGFTRRICGWNEKEARAKTIDGMLKKEYNIVNDYVARRMLAHEESQTCFF